MESRYKCHNKRKIKEKIRYKKAKFIICLAFFAVFIFIMGSLAYLGYTRLAKQLTVVVIIASILFGVGSIVFLKLLLT